MFPYTHTHHTHHTKISPPKNIMENSENAVAAIATTSSEGSPSPSTPSSPPLIVLSPCAACKILRRRCVERCVLAPYFPPSDPLKFTIAHRVFGASNIIKLLQELPESQRADAVTSMVYEANARLRDPVYGCAGAICHLQKQINELQAELAKAQAEILNFQCQNASLFELVCKSRDHHDPMIYTRDNDPGDQPIMAPYIENSSGFFLDESILGVAWEPLWT